ncbi:hypothetical protein [Peptostreptococcus canis]|uniref:V/A-type H+-transporting ATPase subunit G/H n=1 Tax=Peptostreptococcus canis TaxID=1159213 RepID=A0ABR6TMW1_9FIRM|nr:hypothetical protein [Peptostreptococcus canis]MBC2576771.1 hypothetical protein [Peptostreptococcus canis]MBP1998871.1 V/A-type H+-transporting ATPase subunit G/H [Peptostreptococcus canis]
MAKEALLKIVEAEEQADFLVKKAKEDAKKMINAADAKSKGYIEDMIIKAKAECERLKSQAEYEIKEELEYISCNSDDKCKSIVEIPQDKFDEAKKILVERIVK